MKKSDTSYMDRAHSASFRDPAGFVYADSKGRILRQINQVGAVDFDMLHQSKLYDALAEDELLIKHQVVPNVKRQGAYKTIQPKPLPFISYPFEWSFSQLQDAALATLKIQRSALRHGMTLKDASAYNVQFVHGRPLFIDTLSFEAYKTGEPWSAYQQFCKHFLAPLALMAYTDLRLSQLLRVYLDGVPLDLASKLLPGRTRLRPGLAMHLFLHAKAQRSKEGQHQRQTRNVGKQQLLAILESLERTVRSLKPLNYKTEWGDYYANTNYTIEAADQKAKSLKRLVKELQAKTALDLGGNNGRYSRVLNDMGIYTVCTDIDPNAVEANYRYVRSHHETQMLPLLVDITNPGGALGWYNTERQPVHKRLQTDVVLALALIHHLAISNNLPLSKIAEYFATLAPYAIVEFVPKQDSQVQKLLSTRPDIFPNYNETGCKEAFSKYFTLIQEEKVKGTKRTLYLFKRKR